METKLKFKAGDKVRVKSLEWYDSNKNAEGKVYKDGITDIHFSEGMTFWCGKIVQIKKIHGDTYVVDDSFCYWQDWMFEDEAVTEQKQEQLNKNDMETKEMTRKEVADFLRHTKVLCTSTEETAKVQEKLFELGFEWNTKGKIINENAFLLYIDEPNMFYTEMIKWWIENDKKRIEPNEILAIQLKEEKPKFDPKCLQAFDKVLVKNDTIWYARFFDMRGEGEYQTTSGEFWVDCIPYNEDTKHLHGTAEEAPEKYGKLNI